MSNQPQDASRQSLTDLGYDEAAQAKLASIINSTGTVMVAGPVNSGKASTHYDTLCLTGAEVAAIAAPSTVNLREATAEELAELTRAVEQGRHTDAAL